MPCKRIIFFCFGVDEENLKIFFMHINNCNTGEVKIVMLHRIKYSRVAIKAISSLQMYSERES
jgi:hypothetical protein